MATRPLRWFKTEKNEIRESGGLGTVISCVFGKTALPAISLFPYGVSSKPINKKNCFVGPCERNGNNVIFGYNFDDDENLDRENERFVAGNELKDGELILFSTNDKEQKQGTIRIRSKDGDEDGKGTIEITAANKSTKTGKMTFQAEGDIELYSTDDEGEKQASISLFSKDNETSEGTIELTAANEGRETSKMMLKADGNVELYSTDKDGNESVKISLDNKGNIGIRAANEDKERLNIAIRESGEIKLSNGDGKATITLDSEGNIKIDSAVKIDVLGKGNINISGESAVNISGKSDVNIQGGNCNIKGSSVKIQDKEFLAHTHKISGAVTSVAGVINSGPVVAMIPFESSPVS